MLKCLGLWVKGENLLAQKYEVIKGYPMPRATFMAGVNITL
jgi:iron complex outermembrane receptor protein